MKNDAFLPSFPSSTSPGLYKDRIRWKGGKVLLHPPGGSRRSLLATRYFFTVNQLFFFFFFWLPSQRVAETSVEAVRRGPVPEIQRKLLSPSGEPLRLSLSLSPRDRVYAFAILYAFCVA